MHRLTFAFYVFAAAFIGCDGPIGTMTIPTPVVDQMAQQVGSCDRDGENKPSPVVPTARALADETTIRAVLDKITGTNFVWLPLDHQERDDACSRVMEFMVTLNAMAEETWPEEMLFLGDVAGRYYGMSGLHMVDMSHWDIVWFHTALFVIPRYYTQCGDLTIGDATFTCEGEDRPWVCEDLLKDAVRKYFGEEVYPGITDPEKASAEVLRIGMKGRPEDYKTLGWLAFQTYSDAVWSAWGKALPAGQDKMSTAELERALALIELSFPIGDYSWSDGVVPHLYALVCEEKLPKARRQRFLDLTRKRIKDSNFWNDQDSGTYGPLPTTVDELCKDEEMLEPEPLDPPPSTPIPGAIPRQNQIPPDPAAPLGYPKFHGQLL